MRYFNSSCLATCTAALFATLTAGGAQAQTAAGTAVEEVVITGSRVIQNGNDQPTPVTIVSADQLLQNNPTSAAAALQTLPVLAGMRTPTTPPGNSRQNNAARVLDLRNLGRLRTLTMFDGHRLAPSTPEGETDVTFIPSMLLKRVDVVTGGASAVYGSDAVSGVVNFITDRSFNGLKLDLHYGISERGDAPETKIGIAGGAIVFGGRGHIEGSFEHIDAPGVPFKLERDFGKKVYTVQGGGTAANPYRYIQNTRLSSTSFNGYISGLNATTNVNNPLRDMVFNQNGVLSPFVHGTPIAAGIESGGDGAFYDKSNLQSAATSDVGFGRLDVDATDNTHIYAALSVWKTHNRNSNINNEFRNVTMSATNAFLSPAYQTAMTSRGINTFIFSRMFDNVPETDSETHDQGYMASVGIEGKLGDYKWEAFFAPSWNEQATRNNANFNNAKAFAALDAVAGPGGTVVCNVTLTNPGLYPGCVPLNPFGPTAQSADAINYIMSATQFVAQTQQEEAGASITGAPFSTWAGPVDLALSGELRRLSFRADSNAQPIPANCTGLRFNCTANTLAFAGNVLASESTVRQSVQEVALEANVPLLKKVPFAEALDLSAAVRQTHYDTSGNVTTWKVGLNWRVNNQFTLRAVRSQDIRAPNLNDLFAPRLIQVTGNVRDTHTGIISTAPFITDPNPNLSPEIAQVWSAGLVYRPSFLPGFSAAVDWYSINIDNAITAIQGQDNNTQAICEASNGTSPLCALIVRPLPFSDRSAANTVTAWLSKPQNVLTLETTGVDFEANYQHPLFGGDLVLRALFSYQPHEYLQLPNAPRFDAAGAGYGPCCQLDGASRERVSLFANYSQGAWALDLQERWRSGVRWDPNTALVFAEPDVKSIAYTNATVTFKGLAKTDLFLSVQNLFDQQPTPWGRVSHSGIPGLAGGFIPGDDVIGRYYTFGLRYKL